MSACVKNVSEVKEIVERDARYPVRDWHFTIKSSLHSKEYLECSKDFCQVDASFFE